MFVAAALLALAATPPASPGQAERPGARIQIVARIVTAAEVRGGRSDVPHQRRRGLSPERTPLTLVEFE
jgi:hypothetical protein